MASDLKNVVFLAGSTVGLGLALFWLGYNYFYRRRKPYRCAVVTSLHIHPVKSCARVDVSSMEVDKLGPAYDRYWVLVNAKGKFQSQIQIPKMALVQPSFEGTDHLCLDAPDMPTMKVKLDIEDENFEEKKDLDSSGVCRQDLDCGQEVGQWFDSFLGKSGLRLHSGWYKNSKWKDSTVTTLSDDVAKQGVQVMYPKLNPVLLISEASLEALNSHICNTVSMKVFRPNVVVSGCAAYEEDAWQTVMIGNTVLRQKEPAARCLLTTVDPDSGHMSVDKEPLRTLKRLRMPPDSRDKPCDGPLFGVYFSVVQTGTINVGDEVLVLSR